MTDKILLTVHLGDGYLDDTYEIYQSGKVIREFDRNSFKPNQLEEIELKKLKDWQKEKILTKCPKEIIELIKNLMYE